MTKATEKPRIKYVVTHGGISHMGDLAAVGLAMHVYGHVPCFRRDPTEAELMDPEVVVLDVGRRHNPLLRNFDHHQLAGNSEACAFSLLAEHFGYAEVLETHTKWYGSMKVLDQQSPFRWARKNGYKNFPFGLLGLIGIGVRRRFSQFYGARPVDPSFTHAIMECVREAVGEAMKVAVTQDRTRSAFRRYAQG